MGTLIPSHWSSLIPSRDDLFYPFQQYFDKVVDEFFSDSAANTVRSKMGYPRLDVITEEGKWIVEASVPGVKLSDLRVEMLPVEQECKFGVDAPQRHILLISGRMSEDHQYKEGAHWHVRELKRSGFERRILLPEFIKDEPQATIKDGILRLTWDVPELKRPKPKQVVVKNLDEK